MKLSEIKGQDAIDVIADIIDPVTEIMADEVLRDMFVQKPRPHTLLLARAILKRQKKAILEILAYLNNESPDTFNPSLIELPVMLFNLINEIEGNEELMNLFHSQRQMMASVSSGAVTEPIKATETM